MCGKVLTLYCNNIHVHRYTGFSDAVRHNPDILQCFLSGMDATQLQNLTLQLRSDTFSIVGKGTTASKDLRSHTSRVSLVRMLCQTFKWETFEQVCVWEILRAEQACNYTVLMTIAWYVDVPLSPEAKLGIVPILLALIDHDTFNSHSVPRCAGDLSLLLALVPKLGTSTVGAVIMCKKLSNFRCVCVGMVVSTYPFFYVWPLVFVSSCLCSFFSHVSCTKSCA